MRKRKTKYESVYINKYKKKYSEYFKKKKYIKI